MGCHRSKLSSSTYHHVTLLPQYWHTTCLIWNRYAKNFGPKAPCYYTRITFAVTMPMSLADPRFQVQLIRPLLGVRKAQLEQFCREEGLHWVEDPTNQDTSFLRNLLRQRLAQSSAAARLNFSGPGEGASAVHSALASLPADHDRGVDDSAKRHHAQCSRSDADLLLNHGDEAVIDGEAAASSVVSDILRLSSACRDGREKLEQWTAALVSAATNFERDRDTLHSSSESVKTSSSQQHQSVSSVDKPTLVNLRQFRGANRHIGIRAIVQILQVQAVVTLMLGRLLSLSWSSFHALFLNSIL